MESSALMPGSTSTPSTAAAAILQGETTKRSSHIFQIENGEEVLDGTGEGTGKWKCNRCTSEFKPISLSTTKNALNHLETKHGINRNGAPIPGWTERRGRGTQQTLQQLRFSTTKGRQVVHFHWKVMKAKLVRWIVRNNIPFTVVEQKDFRTLLLYIAHTKPSVQ